MLDEHDLVFGKVLPIDRLHHQNRGHSAEATVACLMTQRFGDRTTFAVEVGQSMSADLRVVDLWAAGKWLTTDDMWSSCHRSCDVYY
jgi:hypothetical protein